MGGLHHIYLQDGGQADTSRVVTVKAFYGAMMYQAWRGRLSCKYTNA